MTNQATMANVKCQMLNAKCQGRRLRRGSAGARPPFNIYHLTFIIFVLALPGCGTWNRATQARRDIYMNLMTPLQQAQYLHMEATERPVSLRLAYLQEIGVYQQWSEQPKSIQEAILRQQVVEGMTPLHVQMAWGLPDERSDETEPAERAAGHTKTVWEYRVRHSRTGPASQERSVCFFDDRVLWVRRIR